MAFFYGNRKKHPKIHMESQESPNSQNNLEKEEQTEDSHFPGFKTYHEATVIETGSNWHRYTH